jgi:hypothetical protein
MEYVLAGMCGTLWPGWWKGPGGPPGWLVLVVAILGGVVAYAVVGPVLAPDRGIGAIALLGVVGGNFAVQVVSAILPATRGAATTAAP